MAQRIATQMTTHQTNPIDLPKLLVPVLFGHLKAEGHLGRCYLKGRAGDAANVNRIGPTATLLEWDDRIPSFDEVHAEARKAEQYIHAPVAAGL